MGKLLLPILLLVGFVVIVIAAVVVALSFMRKAQNRVITSCITVVIAVLVCAGLAIVYISNSKKDNQNNIVIDEEQTDNWDETYPPKDANPTSYVTVDPQTTPRGGEPEVSKYKEYTAGYNYFTVRVNQNKESVRLGVDQKDDERLRVYAYIRLPETYTTDGAPTKLLMLCHGAGKGVNTAEGGDLNWTNYDNYNNMVERFVNAGYAVFDCNGIQNSVYWCNFWGDIRGVSCWEKAYEYIIENYNVEDEFSIYGFSMGGLTAMAIANQGFHLDKIKCIAMGSPVTALEPIWNQGNNNQLFKHLYGFDDLVTFQKEKVVGSDPSLYIYNDGGVEKYEKTIGVPIKIWFGSAEDQPSPNDAKRLADALANSGEDVTFRLVPNGNHGICFGAVPFVVSEILEFIEANQ